MMIRFAFLCALVFASGCLASAHSMPDLRDELLVMRHAYREARNACDKAPADELTKCYQKSLAEVDRPNTKRINEIFTAHGFPTVQLVGSDGLKAYILIMQHSGDIE